MEHKVKFYRTREGFITKISVEIYSGLHLYSNIPHCFRNIHKLRCSKKLIIHLFNKGTIFLDSSAIWSAVWEGGVYEESNIVYYLLTDDLRRIHYYKIKEIIDKTRNQKVRDYYMTKKSKHKHNNIEMMKRAYGKINYNNSRHPW